MNKTAIKSTVNSRGWKEIEAIFSEYVANLTNTGALDLDKDDRHIAIQVAAAQNAKKMVEGALSQIHRIANEEVKKKESFK